MNIHPIKMVYKFNQEAGLLDDGYDDRRESAYPIEEMLETFVNAKGKVNFGFSDLAEYLGKQTPKEISRYIMEDIEQPIEPKEVDILDKHLDSIVFNLGAIFKLGLTPQQAMRGLQIVMEANMQKLKVGKDSIGKQQKPDDFIPPEAKLQKLLDECTKK